MRISRSAATPGLLLLLGLIGALAAGSLPFLLTLAGAAFAFPRDVDAGDLAGVVRPLDVEGGVALVGVALVGVNRRLLGALPAPNPEALTLGVVLVRAIELCACLMCCEIKFE